MRQILNNEGKYESIDPKSGGIEVLSRRCSIVSFAVTAAGNSVAANGYYARKPVTQEPPMPEAQPEPEVYQVPEPQVAAPMSAPTPGQQGVNDIDINAVRERVSGAVQPTNTTER